MAKKPLSAQNRADLKQVFDDIGTGKLKGWIEDVANGKVEVDPKTKKERVLRSPNPGRAAELMLALAEYVKPKLARVENTGKDSGPLRVIIQQVKGGS